MHPFTQNHGKLYGSVQQKAAQRQSLARLMIAARSLCAQAPAQAQNILSGSTDFVSEKLIAYEIGHRAQLSDQLATSIATFYNDYRDIRSTTPGTISSPSLLTFANNLEGETYGMELSATYQPRDNWRLRGGYNLIKENLHVKAGQMDFNRALNETADPEQQVSLHSSIDLPNRLQLDLGLRWVDTLHNNNGAAAGTVPSYFEADIRVGWLLYQKLELAMVGQNLLHDHHPEYGYPDTGREEISRSVVAKAAWSF